MSDCNHWMGVLVSGPPDTGYSCSITKCSECGAYGARPHVGSFFAESRQQPTFWRPSWRAAYEAARDAKNEAEGRAS